MPTILHFACRGMTTIGRSWRCSSNPIFRPPCFHSSWCDIGAYSHPAVRQNHTLPFPIRRRSPGLTALGSSRNTETLANFPFSPPHPNKEDLHPFSQKMSNSYWPSWLWGAAGPSEDDEIKVEEQPDPNIPRARVAIIGAGVGGACSAYFLNDLLGNKVQFDVFEAEAVGGRASCFEYEDEVYEGGASMLYHGNKYFSELAEKVGCKKEKIKDDGTIMSIFDGDEIVFQTSWFSIITAFRVYWRYGFVPLKYGHLAKKTFLENFKKIYDVQDEGKAFNTPDELLKAVDLFDYTQMSVHDLLKDKFGGEVGLEAFEEELAASVNRINYNQGMSMNAFAGLVSYLPAADPKLFKLEEGNEMLPKKILESLDVKVHMDHRVTSLSQHPDGTFVIEVFIEEDERTEVFGPFDSVIVAKPLEFSNINFDGIEMPEIPSRKFKTTVTTYVRGVLDPFYFNKDALPFRSAICLTEMADERFTSIAFKEYYDDETKLFKIFSPQMMASNVLSQLFRKAEVVYEKAWQAYPTFEPPEHFSPFVLADGLYYNNAIETAASALEMSAIAGRNSALLARNFLKEKFKWEE